MRGPRSGAAPLLAALSLMVAVQPSAAGGPVTPDPGPGQQDVRSYIVLLEEVADPEAAAREAELAYGASVEEIYLTAVRGYSARMTVADARTLSRDPRVDRVEADAEVSVAAQRVPTGIARADADVSPTAAIDGRDRRVNADVAVIDTGVDLDHPDLNVHRSGARNCVTGRRSADDQNGHGTHVAGTIAALDNRRGVVGMAPGARIWPVRVLGEYGSGSMSDVICGVDYVTRHARQIEVANMSLGASAGADDGQCGSPYGDALHRAVCASVAAGVTYVVAAGNGGHDAAQWVPARYDEVITVSALADFDGRPGGHGRQTCRRDVDDTFADYSSYGADVDLIAPGVCIRSTLPGGVYGVMSGTSMAAPHVAGGAALYLSRRPAAAPRAVRAVLRAHGSRAWRSTDDPDGIQEPLLNVSRY